MTSPCTCGSVASRPRAAQRETLSQLWPAPAGVDRRCRPGGGRAGGGRRAAAEHPPPQGACGDGGGTADDHRAPLHRPAAVLDEGCGVGRVALAGEQVLDDGVEVDVERPVRRGEAVRGPGGVVGRDQPGVQGGGAGAHVA